jgi:hypothetical protein
MSLALKKQFSDFEIDEFTQEVSVTVEEAIAEISQFDWITESEKSAKIIEEHAEPSLWFRNGASDTLSMCWADHGKFAVYVMIKKGLRRSSTSIVKGQEEIFNLIALFASGERHLLLNRLQASEQHYQTLWLLDLMDYFVKTKTRHSREVTQEEHVFRITFTRVFKKLIFSIVLFLFPAVLWFNPFQTWKRPIDWTMFFAFQGFFTLLAVPAIIITVNHLKKNAGWNIYFRKGDNTFFIVHKGGKQMFDKGDFKKRIVTENSSNAPWSEFHYNTLLTTEGKQLHISNLLVPTADMDKLFGRMDTQTENSRFQIIRNKRIQSKA